MPNKCQQCGGDTAVVVVMVMVVVILLELMWNGPYFLLR